MLDWLEWLARDVRPIVFLHLEPDGLTQSLRIEQMSYVDRILASLDSQSLEDNLWGATFAAGADEQNDQIIKALITLLQRNEKQAIGRPGDINYELCIGRAASGLVRILIRIPTRTLADWCSARALLAQLASSECFQISGHANEGLSLLEEGFRKSFKGEVKEDSPKSPSEK